MSYKYEYNPLEDIFDLMRDEIFHVKDPVDTYNDLPITGNGENDMRFVKDTDEAYVWTIPASSGSLSDWKRVSLGGDMLKSTYDTNSNSIVDKAESIDDGVNSASAADIKDAVDKKHTQDTDTVLTTDGATKLIETGTLKNNLAVDSLKTIDGRDVSVDGAKLDGVEDNATADQTALEIQTAAKADVDIADAISKKHIQNTDQKLDEGGANEIAANEMLKATTGDIEWNIEPETGSDVTGDGTEENPFATFNHALSLLPEVINHEVVLLGMESEAFTENVIIRGFSGTGNLRIEDVGLNTSSFPFTIESNLCYISLISVFAKVTASFGICFNVSKNGGLVILDGIGVDSGGFASTKGVDIDESILTITQAEVIDNDVAIGIKVGMYGIVTYRSDTVSMGVIPIQNNNGVITDSITLNKSDYDDAVAKKHEHSNKALLDTYDQTNADITDAISKEHIHSNKSELDLVTDGDHDVRNDNPHAVNVGQLDLASGTVASDIDDAISKKHNQNTDTALRTDKLIVDSSGNTDIVGELSIKVYSQDTEPILTSTSRMAIWIDTNDSNRTYLIFQRSSGGDQVAVELA